MIIMIHLFTAFVVMFALIIVCAFLFGVCDDE